MTTVDEAKDDSNMERPKPPIIYLAKEQDHRVAMALKFDLYGTNSQVEAAMHRIQHMVSIAMQREVGLVGYAFTTDENSIEDKNGLTKVVDLLKI